MKSGECKKPLRKDGENNTNIIEAFFASAHMLCPKVTVSPVNSQPVSLFSTIVEIFKVTRATFQANRLKFAGPVPKSFCAQCLMKGFSVEKRDEANYRRTLVGAT